MRHRNAGFKLGRNTSHRRAMLRNLVTSIIVMDRVETTITKCKATRPIVEKMITLGKRGDVHARRQAAAYLIPEARCLRSTFLRTQFLVALASRGAIKSGLCRDRLRRGTKRGLVVRGFGADSLLLC